MRAISRKGRGPVLAAAILLGFSISARGDESLPLLNAGGKSYTNALVTEKNSKVIFVRHAGGIATIKVSDLDDDVRVRLGFPPLRPAVPVASATTVAGTTPESSPSTPKFTSNPGLRKIQAWFAAALEKFRTEFKWTWTEVAVFAAALASYFFGCKACWDLCRRAGHPSSILVWLPGFKRLALFKAVGLSRLWFVFGCFIPLVGFIAWVKCSLLLCEMFNRSKWLVFPLMLPPLAPLVLISLAHSSQTEDHEPAVRDRHPNGPCVEGIIAGDLPLRTLKKSYTNVVTGLVDYGKAWQRQFCAGRYIDCEVCKTGATSEIQGYQWVAKVQPRFNFSLWDFLLYLLGFVGVKVQQTVIEFETTHSLCDSCAKKSKFRRAMSAPVKAVAFGLFLISLGVTLMGLAGLAYVFNSRAQLDQGFLWTSIAGFGGLILAWIGYRVERSLRIPFPFRTIARRPFRLANVRIISTAAEQLAEQPQYRAEPLNAASPW